MLIFVGAIIGLSVYQSQNRTSKQVKVANPQYDQVNDLTERYWNDEIQNFACDCNHPFDNMPPINATQNAYCRQYINANGTGVSYISLCDDLDEAIDNQYSRSKISSASLLDIIDFSDAVYVLYLDSCGKVIASNFNQAKNVVTYFNASGVGNESQYREMIGFWQIMLDQAIAYDSSMCDAATAEEVVESEPAYTNCDEEMMKKLGIQSISTYWDDYFCFCAPKSCTYSEPQSDFDVFLVLVSYIGTLFGVIMAIAAIMYGLLYAQYADIQSKKDRRRKRNQEAKDMEMKLDAPLKEEEESSPSQRVEIRDDASDLGGEEEKKEGAFRQDKCFVTACSGKPANAKTMFCARHGGITMPDSPPQSP